MNYSISDHDSVQVLLVNDLLNEYDNKLILKEVNQLVECGFTNFIIDLSPLKFINSVGLNFLLSVRSKTKDNGGDLALVNASQQVVNLLKITKLSALFNLCPSLQLALEDLKQIK